VSDLASLKTRWFVAEEADEISAAGEALIAALEAEVERKHAALTHVVMDRNVGHLDDATQQAVSDAYRAALPREEKT
jgi:hypothetical protein